MIIGITGGIGSGKSTIARELARRGFVVYDCDQEAKRIIAENADVQQEIIDLLGEEAFIKVQSDKVQSTKDSRRPILQAWRIQRAGGGKSTKRKEAKEKLKMFQSSCMSVPHILRI